jgi:mRNA interferase MazF
MVVKRGHIWLTKFDPTIDSEQKGTRPALIVSNDIGNQYGPTVIVVPLTSQIAKKRLPTHVLIPQATTGLKADSVALTEHVRGVSKLRLVSYLASVDVATMKQVDNALKIAMELD